MTKLEDEYDKAIAYQRRRYNRLLAEMEARHFKELRNSEPILNLYVNKLENYRQVFYDAGQQLNIKDVEIAKLKEQLNEAHEQIKELMTK